MNLPRYIYYKWLQHRAINYARLRRIELGSLIAEKLNFQVQYGVFKGMYLANSQTWGISDLGTKLLGMYELEVVNAIHALIQNKKNVLFVDIGAAEGYFAIGFQLSGFIKKTICFEQNSDSRNLIKMNSILNNVEKQIQIFSNVKKDLNFFKIIDYEKKKSDIDEVVFLCDIEGYEYELFFQSKIFDYIKGSFLVIEIHDACNDVTAGLKEHLSKEFEIEEIRTTFRDTSKIIELEDFSDDDRSIIVSEGRSRRGRWWLLSPKPTKNPQILQ